MKCNHKTCLYWDNGECYRLNQQAYGDDCTNYVNSDEYIGEQFSKFLLRYSDLEYLENKQNH